MSLAVVVPVRAFDLGKSRLAEWFSSTEREVLARAMAEIVVAPRDDSGHDTSHDTGHDTEWFVVCDDERVAAWAESRRATPILVSASGLNAALVEARDSILPRTAATHVVISHADLPLVGDLVAIVREAIDSSSPSSIVIAPDRRHDGTNVIAVPRDRFPEWEFCYGPDSFAAHRAVATRLGLDVFVLDDASLATDVDTVDDLVLVRDFITATLPHWSAP